MAAKRKVNKGHGGLRNPPGGRPETAVKAEQVESMRFLGATEATIADFYGITRRAFQLLRKRKPDIDRAFTHGRIQGELKLREKRWKVAMGGSVPMLIHLSKVMLDEQDKIDLNHSGAIQLKPLTEYSDEELPAILAALEGRNSRKGS